MLNVKEVTKVLNSEGITDNEKTVTQWIREGKIKASRVAQVKIRYSIHHDDLAAFISEKKLETIIKDQFQERENIIQENERLKEEIDELRSMLSIEQTKNHSLKKMLKAELALSESKPLTIHSFIGLDAAAEKQDIKRELKKMLKALHPDRGGDERLFKAIHSHYQKL